MNKTHSLEILFEDDWIVVVVKPSGMLSVGYPGSSAKTAQDILSDMKKSKGKIQIAVVHRLDRDTSGVMMFAKTADAKKRIMDGWQEIVTERTYRAVCARSRGAKPLPDSGTIDAPLAYNRYDVGFVPREGDRAALKDAEKAVTHFRVVERGASFDLVECELETGRKNQIRIHMAHLGHPVAGDDVYGKEIDSSVAGKGGASAENSPIGRLALHARVLAFNHPFTGDHQRFESPEPAEFSKLVLKKTKSGPGGATRGAKGTDSAPWVQAAKTSGSRAAKGGLEATDVKVPRRQRGKKTIVRAENYGTARVREKKERDVEDLTDLKPLPNKSRTKQAPGKSRFIPGK